MTQSEKIAEEIMLYVYSRGNALSVRDIKNRFKDEDFAIATDNMNTILCKYGIFYEDSYTGNRYYGLNADGIEFASEGCFSGKQKRDKLAIRRANLSLWISGLALLIALATFLFEVANKC